MRILTFLAIAYLAAFAQAGAVEDAAQATQGFLLGVFRTDVEHLEECFSGGDIVYADLAEIHRLLKDGGAASIAQALFKMKDLIPHMNSALTTCKQVPQEMKEDLRIMRDNFTSFTKVLIMVKNAALHGRDIFKDAAAAITDFNRDKR